MTNAPETELINAPADELKAALFRIIDENRELRAQVARLSEPAPIRWPQHPEDRSDKGKPLTGRQADALRLKLWRAQANAIEWKCNWLQAVRPDSPTQRAMAIIEEGRRLIEQDGNDPARAVYTLLRLLDETREERDRLMAALEECEGRQPRTRTIDFSGPIWTTADGQALSDLLALISPDCDVLWAMRNYLAGHFPPDPAAWRVSAYSQYCDDSWDVFGVQLEYRGDEREEKQPAPRPLNLKGATIMTRLTTGATGDDGIPPA